MGGGAGRGAEHMDREARGRPQTAGSGGRGGHLPARARAAQDPGGDDARTGVRRSAGGAALELESGRDQTPPAVRRAPRHGVGSPRAPIAVESAERRRSRTERAMSGDGNHLRCQRGRDRRRVLGQRARLRHPHAGRHARRAPAQRPRSGGLLLRRRHGAPAPHPAALLANSAH